MTADIAQLGIRVDSNTTKTAATDLDKMTAAAGRADVAVERVGTAHGKMASGASKASFQSRMVAQQLSQVAQQSMATGNFIQALAIQLPDMALGFGAVGIAAGVVAGVALPLLASAFGGTRDRAKEVTDALEGLDGATAAYVAAVQAATAPTDELAAKYGVLATQARAALQAMSDVTLVDAINATNASIQAVVGSLLQVQAIGTNGRSVISELRLTEDFGLAADQALRLRDALLNLNRADGLQAQATAAAEVQRQLLAAYGSVQKMPAPIQAAYAQMAQITIKAAEVNTTVSKMPGLFNAAASAASAAAGAVGAIGNAANSAYGAVSTLVGKMYELAAAQQQAFKDASLGYGKVVNSGGVDAIARAGNNAQGVDIRGKATSGAGGVFRASGGGGGGGGGGGRTDDFAARLEKLRTEHETELQQANAWYAEAQALLADRRSMEILGAQGHKDKLLEIERIHQQQIAEINANAAAARLNDTASLFGSLATIAEVGGKKTAKAAAILAAIQTTVSGYATAMSAAAQAPTLAGKIAAYAGWIATTVKAVSAIKSAGGVGGGSGIGGGGRGPAAQGREQAAAPQSKLIIQGIKLTDIFTGQMLFDMLGDEAKLRNIEFLR